MKTEKPIEEAPDSVYKGAGRLSLIDLSPKEREVFLALLARHVKTTDFDFLNVLLPSTDLFRFLDLFEGQTIQIPNRDEVLKIIEQSQIYAHIASRVQSNPLEISSEGIPDKTLSAAASKFDRRKTFIRSTFDRVKRTLLTERTGL